MLSLGFSERGVFFGRDFVSGSNEPFESVYNERGDLSAFVGYNKRTWASGWGEGYPDLTRGCVCFCG